MHFQRVAALAIALALATPLSLFAETRGRQRTETVPSFRFTVPSPATGYRQLAINIVSAMNRERDAYGLPPLHINSRLSLAAGDRIGDMFGKHYFAHVSPDGIKPWTWVERRGYDYREIGENLAVGYRNAGAVVHGWMQSPGHRANILGRGFDEVGVAVAPGSPTRSYRGPTVVALYGER
jgi:uncharacterized protein YkwD